MIETAVIPAAGRGLRMRPLTAAVPKEMLPLGSSALTEYTIRELVASRDKENMCCHLKTFQALKENNFPLYGTILEGIPCDLESWEGYYYYQRVILEHLNFEEKSL